MAKSVISASDLKARCARVIQEVEQQHRTVVVTRRGRPVAKIVPMDERPSSLFGCLRGLVTIHGDIVEPVEVEWEAAR